MSWGTNYTTNITLTKSFIDSVEDDKNLEKYWNEILVAISMTPEVDVENPFDWTIKCNDFLNERISKIETIYRNNALRSEYYDTLEIYPQNITDEGNSYNIKISGFCSRISEDQISDTLNDNISIVKTQWNEILSLIAATPGVKKDDEGNEFEFQEWCSFTVNRYKQEICEYVMQNVMLEQCEEYLKNNNK